MPLTLSELLSHLPEQDRAAFLNLPERSQAELRAFILESARLPRSKSDLRFAPGTVSGPAVDRTREVDRGFIEAPEIDFDLDTLTL